MSHPRRIPPEPGQESVWDYPRPPRLEPVAKRLRVVLGGATIADTTRGLRVLETSHPPVYYLPPEDIGMDHLDAVEGSSFCEWKGWTQYFDVEANGRRADRAAWCYPRPTAPFAALGGHVAFYAHAMDACFVDEEQVRAQPGSFYGGWITDAIVGPFKGDPGTAGW